MAFNVLEDYQRLLQMCETGKIGWWQADFTQRTLTLSEYICNMLGLKDNALSFTRFRDMIHPDYRDVIAREFLSLERRDHFDERFPLVTSEGYLWVRSRYGHRETTDDGTITVFGTQQFIKAPKNATTDDKSYTRINRLLFRLNTISQSLYKFFRESDINTGINDILEDIRDSFNASRVYIMEFSDDQSILKTTHEMTGIKTEGIVLAEASVSHMPLWQETVLAGKPMIIDNAHMLTDKYAGERKLMYAAKVNSMMLMPLVNENKTWGILGVDISNGFKQWNNEDFQWLSSLTNIINTCIRLDNEKKKTEQSHHLLLNIFHNLPVGVEIYDKYGKLTNVNRKDLEIFGVRDKEDMLGIDLNVNPNFPFNLRNRIYEEEDVEFDTRYEFSKTKGYYKTNKKGSMDLTIRLRKRYDINGKFDGYIFICMDNTEKTKIQKRISEFENFFVIISDYAKVGYAKFNLLNNQGYAIPQWYKNLGEQPFTPLFEVVNIYKNMHPDDRRKLQAFLSEAKEGKTRQYQAELRISRPEEGWNYIRVYIILNNYSPETGVVEITSINYDITELKETEAELIEARDLAETSDRLKSAFLANITHEIRTPLNAIVNMSEFLTEENDFETKEQYKSIIKQNNEQLLKIISDIIDLSTTEAEISLKKQEIDVNTVCQGIIEKFRNKVTSNVQLSFTSSWTRCGLVTDGIQLEKVLSELINNSIKFTTQGSISLGYEILGNNCIRFHVTDTGIGILPEEQERIFKPFVKLDSFVKGTGIGLPLCKSIIDRIGGQIGVESAVGQGSTFWIILPISG